MIEEVAEFKYLGRDEETGEWRRLHNTELKDLYGKPDIIRKNKSHRLRWVGHVARMGDGRGVRRILEGKPEGKRPVGRPRMKDVWRAYVRTAMNLRVRQCQ
ncbi:hypothetical protein C0J52_18606 [Blattella germanica]|nr:hypothetical protein C0J52_18606 [Blattella germanica]